MDLMGKSSSQSDCHLLRLPRELRDYIYAFALYEPDGIFYYRDEQHQPRFTRAENDKEGINQLKFTCRQLRAETRGLELESNELVFVKDKKRSLALIESNEANAHMYLSRIPALQLHAFLNMCSESWRQRIRRVRLQAPATSIENHFVHRRDIPHQHDSNYRFLAYFCWSNPKMIIRWQLRRYTITMVGKRDTVYLMKHRSEKLFWGWKWIAEQEDSDLPVCFTGGICPTYGQNGTAVEECQALLLDL